MKKSMVILCAVLLVVGFAGVSNAALLERAGGLMYYDDVLKITWLRDANYAQTSGYDADGLMTWNQAIVWIASLNNSSFLGYDDWRLPHTLPVNGFTYNYNWSPNGSTDYGYNASALSTPYAGSIGHEMAYMYFNNLKNKALYAINGTHPQDGWGLKNTGPFLGLQPYDYWSCTDYAPLPDVAWNFEFDIGGQHDFYKGNNSYAWAVRDGDSAPVPEPATMLLIGSGLAGLAIFRKRFRKA